VHEDGVAVDETIERLGVGAFDVLVALGEARERAGELRVSIRRRSPVEVDDRDAQALQVVGEEAEAKADDARRTGEKRLAHEGATIASVPAARILGPDGPRVHPLSGELFRAAGPDDHGPGADFLLARRLRESAGAPLGEVYT